MANPTTNYSFAMPTNVDLVKDLPADFDIFGQAVDDRIKALNPETTAGDISYRASTANAKSRLAIGTAGQVLTVNSGATAPEWATASSGGMTLISTTTLSGSTTTISSIPATYKNLQVVVRNPDSNNNPVYMKLRFNSDSNTRYREIQTYGITDDLSMNDSSIDVAFNFNSTTTEGIAIIDIYDYTNTTTFKIGHSLSVVNDTTDATYIDVRTIDFCYNQLSAISSLTFVANVGSFTSGDVLLYGVK